MSVSTALEKSARAFCSKYSCDFDFNSFEASVEEFTFLRPVGGWIAAYKMMFEKMYMQALEPIAKDRSTEFNGEVMLDDFEYTLIRPYVNESKKEIRHQPYAGMDRVSRLEYLQQMTKRSPSNFVDLYAEKYKNGQLSIQEMRSRLENGVGNRAHCVEMAGCIQALETVHKSRSFVWRALHPFKNHAEKRSAEQMKRVLMAQTQSSEEAYSEMLTAAYKTFDGHQRAKANLEQNMVRAREEMSRKQKMNEAMRESLHLVGFEKEPARERSQRVEQHSVPTNSKQM
jgi:hypothetical protein